MLKPAIIYKQELEQAMKKYFYTDEMMFYCGYYAMSHNLSIDEEQKGCRYQWAVLDDKLKLIGYIDYTVDYYSSCARNFGAICFDKPNAIMGKELYNLFEKLLKQFHRVEFYAVSGNPATRGYDKFLEKHKDIGRKIILRDTFKDEKGKYHDSYTYEFVN